MEPGVIEIVNKIPLAILENYLLRLISNTIDTKLNWIDQITKLNKKKSIWPVQS